MYSRFNWDNRMLSQGERSLYASLIKTFAIFTFEKKSRDVNKVVSLT